jgi:hypothetical protein
MQISGAGGVDDRKLVEFEFDSDLDPASFSLDNNRSSGMLTYVDVC